MELAFWISALTLAYIYIGYPVMLLLLSKIKGREITGGTAPLPDVSFIIAAHNEEEVIYKKLENTLALDYPDEQLEIIVVSDQSTDRTEEMVSDYDFLGVSLLKTPKRVGKTGAQNEAAGRARGAVLVFSDANSIWERDALRNPVRLFSDKSIGYACGRLKYTNTGEAGSSHAEGLYWRYEVFLRRLESAVGSITAGNGAIYAVPSEDYCFFRHDQSHDFEFPRHVTSQGKRAVYVDTAVAYEKTGSTSDEFRRKVRMMGRVWGSILKSPGIFSPFHTNALFSWQFISHRLMRYLAPIPQVIAFASNLFLYPSAPLYQILFALQVIFYSSALIGGVFQAKHKFFYLPYYFCLFNFTSVLGLAKLVFTPAPAYWEKAGSTREQ